MLEVTARMVAAADLAAEKAKARKHYDYWTEKELEQELNCLIAGILKSNTDENSGTGT
jgi:hypothetical protein